MTPEITNLPERLRVVGATDLEARLLAAAASEQPSSELRDRMAAAIGITGAAPSAPPPLEVGAAPAKAAAGSSLTWPLVSVGVLVLAATGIFFATRARGHSTPVSTPQPTVAAPEPAPSPVAAPAAPIPAAPVAVQNLNQELATAPAAHRHVAPASAANDLRAQIAMLDSARAAIAEGAAERALGILHRYQEKYPSGSFRPEATALTVEALVKLERREQARDLAERFVADHRGSPLAERVAKLAGLSQR